jgi:hypothetical protein
MSSIEDNGKAMMRCLIEQHMHTHIYKGLFGKGYQEELGKIVFQPDKLQHLTPYSCTMNRGFWYTFNRKHTDIVKVRQIIIEYEGNPSDVGIDYIEVEIGGQTLIKIPYFIIEAFETIKSYNTDDSKVVKMDINLSKYINDIQLAALMYHEVRLRIQPNNKVDIKYIQLICDSIFYCNEDRRRINHSEMKFPIHQFEILNITSEVPSTIHTFNMSSNKRTDGLYAASQGLFIGSTSSIKSLKLIVNNKHTILDYDKYLLEYTGKIYGSLLFIPFSFSGASDIYNFNNYKSALPFSRVDSMTAVIETEKPISGLQIASMTPNILIYKHGMGGIMQAPNFTTDVKSHTESLTLEKCVEEKSTKTDTSTK